MPFHLNRYGLAAFSSNAPIDLFDVSGALGISIERAGSVPLERALSCDEDRIGVCDSCLFVCANDNLQYFHERKSELLGRILRIFSGSRGCAVTWFSIPDLFGYAYFENGVVKRVKHGDLNGVWVESGSALSAEQDNRPPTLVNESLVERVAGCSLSDLAAKRIEMFRFHLIN